MLDVNNDATTIKNEPAKIYKMKTTLNQIKILKVGILRISTEY